MPKTPVNPVIQPMKPPIDDYLVDQIKEDLQQTLKQRPLTTDADQDAFIAYVVRKYHLGELDDYRQKPEIDLHFLMHQLLDRLMRFVEVSISIGFMLMVALVFVSLGVLTGAGVVKLVQLLF